MVMIICLREEGTSLPASFLRSLTSLPVVLPVLKNIFCLPEIWAMNKGLASKAVNFLLPFSVFRLPLNAYFLNFTAGDIIEVLALFVLGSPGLCDVQFLAQLFLIVEFNLLYQLKCKTFLSMT